MIRIEISGQLEVLVRDTVSAIERNISPDYRPTVAGRVVSQALCDFVRAVGACSHEDFNNFVHAGNELPPTEPIPGVGITLIDD